MNNVTDGVFFFDSGIGGLSVLSACRELLKGTTFYYYGDNQNAPYGNLPPESIFERVQEIFVRYSFLPIRAAVLACNTVTAVCIERLRKYLPFPVIGAEPAILLGTRQGKRVLVLATKATCESPRFTLLLSRARALYPQTQITVFPCHRLAGAIERGIGGGTLNITPYLPNANPDVVVLGCTHYVFVKEQIAAHYGCRVVDGNQGIAARLQAVLNETAYTPLKNREDALLDFTDFSIAKPKNAEASVFFLGEAKKRNLVVYEQMFAK